MSSDFGNFSIKMIVKIEFRCIIALTIISIGILQNINFSECNPVTPNTADEVTLQSLESSLQELDNDIKDFVARKWRFLLEEKKDNFKELLGDKYTENFEEEKKENPDFP